MLKKITAFALAVCMLFATACSDDNSTDTSKAETTTSASEVTEDSSSEAESSESGSSEIDDSSVSETTTTTEATTTADDSSAADKTTATTKATAGGESSSTTTKSTSASSSYVPPKTTTTTAATTAKKTATTTTTTTKKATTTTKTTQPPVQKSTLDLAYEAMVKCNPTQAQINLIVNDLNNYVAKKGFCTKSVLDKSFYPFVKNGTPTFDIDGSTNFGNCGYFEGVAQDYAASRYYEGNMTLEQAREYYKKELKEHCDYQMKGINNSYQDSKKNGAEYTTIHYSVMIYKDVDNPMQRLDLKYKYPSFKAYVMTIGYNFDW